MLLATALILDGAALFLAVPALWSAWHRAVELAVLTGGLVALCLGGGLLMHRVAARLKDRPGSLLNTRHPA